MGDGRIVHFGEPGKDRPRAVVRITSRDEFLKGGNPITVKYADGLALDPDDSVRLALAQVGDQGYSLAFNNCEHFATYCKTGRKESRQVWRVALGIGVSAAAVMMAAGIRLMRRR